MLLEKMPEAKEFYQTYWGRKPFIVRRAIPQDTLDVLIDGDTLAALAMEDDVKSRLVIGQKGQAYSDWRCDFGPFEARDFSSLAESHWSLLVQNVEQFHIESAALLPHFNFAPRWLMDDIMVSYSESGGGVGPHMDSYHVFLVQGQGKRRWKIGTENLQGAAIDNGASGLQILADDFVGETYDVSAGDVIYIPPFFAHQGETLEPALTYSVGFLGPQLSELYIEYGQYLADQGKDQRYSGLGLTENGAGASLAQSAQQIGDDMRGALDGDSFYHWLARYFSRPTHLGAEDGTAIIDDALDQGDFEEALTGGEVLIWPDYIKMTMFPLENGRGLLGVLGHEFALTAQGYILFNELQKLGEQEISLQDISQAQIELDLIYQLYRLGALELKTHD